MGDLFMRGLGILLLSIALVCAAAVLAGSAYVLWPTPVSVGGMIFTQKKQPWYLTIRDPLQPILFDGRHYPASTALARK